MLFSFSQNTWHIFFPSVTSWPNVKLFSQEYLSVSSGFHANYFSLFTCFIIYFVKRFLQTSVTWTSQSHDFLFQKTKVKWHTLVQLSFYTTNCQVGQLCFSEQFFVQCSWQQHTFSSRTTVQLFAFLAAHSFHSSTFQNHFKHLGLFDWTWGIPKPCTTSQLRTLLHSLPTCLKLVNILLRIRWLCFSGRCDKHFPLFKANQSWSSTNESDCFHWVLWAVELMTIKKLE